MRRQTSEESVRFMKQTVLALAAAIWSAVVPVTWADPPSDSNRFETSEEARPEHSKEWGPEQEGVRTSLVALEKELSLGKPILLRLEMENVGSRVIHYDPTQVAINSSMYIEGNDGVEVPSIAPGAQTGGDLRPLNPGERAVLFESLDIAGQYLLTAPGSYTVRFRGRDTGFVDTPIPPSNVITIRVADGPVRPSRQIARSLFDAGLLPGWRVYVSEEGKVVPLGRSSETGAALALSRDGSLFADAHVVRIWVTASFSPLESPKQDGARERTAEPIGRCPWGEVYLWSRNLTADELSAVRTLIASALSIEAAE